MPQRILSRSTSVFMVPQSVIRAANLESETRDSSIGPILAFFKYLKLDDAITIDAALRRSGKDPECMMSPVGKGTSFSIEHLGSSQTSPTSKTRRVKEGASRAAKMSVESKRKEIEKLGPVDVVNQMQAIFEAYSNKDRYIQKNCMYEMDLLKMLCLLRDSRLLDNSHVTIRKVQTAFTNAFHESRLLEPYIEFEVFLKLLKELMAPPSEAATPASSSGPIGSSPTGRSSMPMPTSPSPHRQSLNGVGALSRRPSMSGPMALPITEDPAVVAIGRSHILPYAKTSGGARPVDSVFTDEMLAFFKSHDAQLRRLFAWYCTLEELDSYHVTWDWAATKGLSLSRARFMLLLLNFNVIPGLISKNQALEAFSKHHREIYPDLDSEAKQYPAFLEALANIALAVADQAVNRIHQCINGSPDDIKIFQRYINCAAPGSKHHTMLTEAMESMLAKRRLAVQRSSSPPREELEGGVGGWGQEPPPAWLTEGLDPVLQQLKKREWALNQRDSCNHILDVVSRREETRMKLALTRLQNTYRDVRPSARDLGDSYPGLANSHVLFRIGGGEVGGGAYGGTKWPNYEPDSSADLHEEQEVAFFSGSLQVKTPRKPQTLLPHAPSFGFPVGSSESLTFTKSPGSYIPPQSAAQRAEAIQYLEQQKRAPNRVATTLVPLTLTDQSGFEQALLLLPTVNLPANRRQ